MYVNSTQKFCFTIKFYGLSDSVRLSNDVDVWTLSGPEFWGRRSTILFEVVSICAK